MASKLPKRKITIYYIQYIEVEEIVLTEDDFPLQNQYIGAVNMEYVNIFNSNLLILKFFQHDGADLLYRKLKLFDVIIHKLKYLRSTTFGF